MPRYYFDIRESNDVSADEEGLELPDVKAAEVEAAQTLAEMAKATLGGAERHYLAVEVRTDDGPLFKAALVYEMTRH